jgi:hypothetical protein
MKTISYYGMMLALRQEKQQVEKLLAAFGAVFFIL